MSFLALDAMLGWKVKKYDGSWLEWGNLSDEEGTLDSDSQWRTDCDAPGATGCAIGVPARSEAVNYVAGTGGLVEACTDALTANQTNENDKQICDPGLQQVDCLFRDN